MGDDARSNEYHGYKHAGQYYDTRDKAPDTTPDTLQRILQNTQPATDVDQQPSGLMHPAVALGRYYRFSPQMTGTNGGTSLPIFFSDIGLIASKKTVIPRTSPGSRA